MKVAKVQTKGTSSYHTATSSKSKSIKLASGLLINAKPGVMVTPPRNFGTCSNLHPQPSFKKELSSWQNQRPVSKIRIKRGAVLGRSNCMTITVNSRSKDQNSDIQITNSSESLEQRSNRSEKQYRFNNNTGSKTQQNNSPAHRLSQSFRTRNIGLDTGFSKISTQENTRVQSSKSKAAENSSWLKYK